MFERICQEQVGLGSQEGLIARPQSKLEVCCCWWMYKASSTLQYSTLQNPLAPANLKDKSFADIVVALKGTSSPNQLNFTKRFHFQWWNQVASESIGT